MLIASVCSTISYIRRHDATAMDGRTLPVTESTVRPASMSSMERACSADTFGWTSGYSRTSATCSGRLPSSGWPARQNAILDHKFKVGAEAGVTLVAVGIGLEGASTAAGGADIVAFANSAGLFAGVPLEGSYLDADSDWNALYYGSGATAKAIVLDGRYTNPGAEPIRQYLAKW